MIQDYINTIKPINRFEYEYMKMGKSKLLTQKLSALSQYLSNPSTKKNIQYFDCLIEYWRLFTKGKVIWDHTIETILKDKLEYLSFIIDCSKFDMYKIFIQKHYINLMLVNQKLDINVAWNDSHYLSLLDKFVHNLNAILHEEQDKLKKIEIRLFAFDAKQKIKLSMPTTKTPDQIHAEMIKEYTEYIALLSQKKGLLESRVNTFKYENPVDKVNDQLEIFNLKFEIRAKKRYSERHFKARKEIK